MTIANIDIEARGCRFSLDLAGAICNLETNDQGLRSTLCDWTSLRSHTASRYGISMQVLVTPGGGAGFNSRSHFRGLHHVVIASFGHDNTFLFDLLRRHIAAKVSQNTARDPDFWSHMLLPIAVGVLGPTVGVVPVHCACLALYGKGLLVAGESGAGKSTLSAALVEAGFEYVSDDWTYLTRSGDGLSGHGMGARIKLLPDAVSFFPSLETHPLTISMNGELAYEVEAKALGGKILRSCTPTQCIFLERASGSLPMFMPMDADRASNRFQSAVERLPSQLDHIARGRAETLRRITQLPCWTFRHDNVPQVAARHIFSFMARQAQYVTT